MTMYYFTNDYETLAVDWTQRDLLKVKCEFIWTLPQTSLVFLMYSLYPFEFVWNSLHCTVFFVIGFTVLPFTINQTK